MGGEINYCDGKPMIMAFILMAANEDDKDNDNVVNVNWFCW